jgi:two-component system, OmpR family, sensor kinase
MPDVKAEADVVEAGAASHRKPRRFPLAAARRLSHRTPLRTKLITAVLGLVIMALAAISIASVYMLRGYVTTQRDSQLIQDFQGIPTYALSRVSAGNAAPTNTNMVLGIQLPGHQLSWPTSSNNQYINGGAGPGPLPSLPTSAGWASGNSLTKLTVPSQSGPDSWRVIAAQADDFPVYSSSGTQLKTVNVVLAVDLGNLNAMTTRLVVFDLIVGGAIVVVLAAVGVAVVQTNLRPLNDIEMTAGQIALGHLDHRVPEGDPRTEIGSLGRSLNAMLAQIERAFHAQEASEQAAHESEERMRRFTADAAHELRTPLTTIRGFAAHYRQRGGADGWRSRVSVGSATGAGATGAGATGAGASDAAVAGAGAAGASQQPSARTVAADSPGARYFPGAGPAADGLSAEELDHLMGRVEAEAARMGLLVEDLLTLARIDQQRPLAKAPVDLLTLAADAVQDARIVAPGRPVDLVVAPGTAFIVDGDEPRLRQVISNLVNNALTHTPAGTPVRLKIGRDTLEAAADLARRAEPDAHDGWATEDEAASAAAGRPTPGGVVPAVVLDVEDDGPGMNAAQAQRVFERFYRADAARNRASGGTGLGLSIVAGLVTAHGGTVSVRTAPGQGADFQVKLPLSPDALPVEEPEDDLPA